MIISKLVNVWRLNTIRLMAPLFLFFILFLTAFSSVYGQSAEAEKHFAECKACHTIGGGRLVGPDLKGVTKKYSEAWLIKFIQNSQAMVKAGDKDAVKVFNEYSKIPMPSHSLTDAQVKDILLYIQNGGKLAAGTAAKPEKKVTAKTVATQTISPAEKFLQEKREGRHNLAVFAVISGVLLLLSLTDLIFTHYLKAKWVHYVILLSALWIIGEWSWDFATGLGRQQNYQPDQPIWFSHKVHAGQNQIDCEYCHFTAERSMHAGIPPASVCMNCHSQVKSGKRTGKKEIAKIYAAIKNNKPIQWVKVHNLPDFVYFNHEQHVKVGKLNCTECHGDVAQMDQIAQVKNLSMGWCLDCHRTHKVQFTDNKFYGSYKKLHEELRQGKIDQVTVKMIGGEDCAKCHY
jgi:cytochrome c551/c552